MSESKEPKTYVTTERAGFVVAGRRIPPVYEKDKPARPTVGYELQLLDAEAEYELAQGTIALRAADVSSGATEKPAADVSSGATEKPAADVSSGAKKSASTASKDA